MKIKKYLIVLILSLLIVLSGCVDSNQEKQDVKVTIEFEEQIIVKESKLMTVYSTFNEDIFTFESSDESIIMVDSNGLVSGVSIGEATITVTSFSGKVVSHTITVIPILLVESIRLEIEEQEHYYAGMTYNYSIEYFPGNASNKNLRFSHSDPNFILNEIDQTITFIRAGEATVFVYLEDEWLIQCKVNIDVKYDSNSTIYDLLFVGNSLTKYTYDIPLMVKNMIEKDGSRVYIDYSTNYQYLDQHEFTVRNLLNKNKYSHVILQEKSDGLITDLDRFKRSVLSYNDLIITNGAKTVLYQTWTYNYPNNETKQWMHEIVSQGYKGMSSEINSSISLVGEVFMEVMMKHPDIGLYEDLKHPSIYGAYLSALVHYKTITGNNANTVTYRPDEISVEIENILKNVVDYVIS
jgi:hypothetical protein